MEAENIGKVESSVEPEDSLRGTLFSTIVFVGGGIIVFIVVLFIFYMTRI